LIKTSLTLLHNRKNNKGGMMRTLAIGATALGLLAGCATQPEWHWEKQGSSQSMYNQEFAQCRAQAVGSTMGMVNYGTIMILHDCMEGKGWEKVANR
jgi:hypothetical protein